MLRKRGNFLELVDSIRGTRVTKKLKVDATKLFESMAYQIHVAIEHCHALEDGDELWIEVLGDVSIPGKSQTEVKNYSDELTDSHENFWNTLNNWLDPDFDHTQFVDLILLTTQPYSERTAFDGWNEMTINDRLKVLTDIHKSSEVRFTEAQRRKEEKKDERMPGEKEVSRPAEPSRTVRLQRIIMDDMKRDLLLELLPKIRIWTEQPGLNDRIAKYKKRYLKGILPSKHNDFLNDMFGFMTDAIKITEGWKFEVGEFDKKFADLTRRYMHGTVVFPIIDSNAIKDKAAKMDVSNDRYAQKLTEIGATKRDIILAAGDMLHAEKYLYELTKHFDTSQQEVDEYWDGELSRHLSKRKSAMIKFKKSSMEELKDESLAFYHERQGEAVTVFSRYNSTPATFRNGIYHLLADEEPEDTDDEFHWRLWE
jgi:hypothetical protein